MMRYLLIAMLLLCGVLVGVSAAQDTYTLNFSTNATQEAVLSKLIHNECARRLSVTETIQTYCTQNAAPNETTCTCTPSTAEKAAFMLQTYMTPGFTQDRQALYRTRAFEYQAQYPSWTKTQRDAVDTAAGKPLLP